MRDQKNDSARELLMLNAMQHKEALLALTRFRDVGWMHWRGSIQEQCFPVSQFMLPIIAQYNSDARVYVGYVEDDAETGNIVGEIEKFMKLPCSFQTPPRYHAWIADNSTGKVLVDYVLPFGTGHSYYSECHNPFGKIYTPVLKDYTQVADFSAALLVHNMCVHHWRLLSACAVPPVQCNGTKKAGWFGKLKSFFS
ncbi:hypothetical protein [Pseudomonas triticifolii]|uniref:Uncharacterized protein n=1 Tax=Pseudomonas triticifolii TaxID=2762592 RepID=A0ABR7BJ98_9PSED|nr:hypothetical protein [Pseudomonas triticifolii]MBC3956695.1 hypothetical protein [Pseudomonas triticifolii]